MKIEAQAQIQNFINGELKPPASAAYIDNYDPAKGAVYGQIPDSDARDVEEARAAAARAFPSWSNIGIQQRAQYLRKIADAIEEQLEDFALAESIDNGKPLSLARGVDIPRAVTNFRFFASAIEQFASESHHVEGVALNYTLRRPLGVVGCISPWNLPLYLFTWKIAPALAAGNCVVAKPSEVTPMTAFMLAQACQKAGLPAGVLNILHGLGGKVGAAIVAHPEIKAISFTGGTSTGRAIAQVAAPQFKKLSLELGGKNPSVIFADADLYKAVETSVRAAFSNQGQICLCGSRIFVEKSVYEEFKKEFVERVQKLQVGHPQEEDCDMGALVSEAHLEKVLGYVALAKEEGGKVLCGGKRIERPGYFMEPTVIEGLRHDCRTNQEEIFGPIVTLTPFEDENEALTFANSTEYGLASSIWTTDLQKAHRMGERIHAGIVWINCWMLRDLRTPFGGMKSSGVGREGGFEALRFFTEPKNICVKY